MILAHRSVILLFLFLFLFSPTHSYQLWDWKERQKRRLERHSKRLALSEPVTNEVITDDNDEHDNEIRDDLPTLNVSSKDSPYALIDKFFPERELNHQFMDRYLEKQLRNQSHNSLNLGQLNPKEVWLSDGNLLVLRGGATPNRKSFDDPFEPLDDYVAPYREPKLPPPDFIPSDTGVGVALPPENEESTTPKNHKNPFKEFLFDEEKFIQEMENFHSERRAELFGRQPRPLAKFKPSLAPLAKFEKFQNLKNSIAKFTTSLPIVWKSSTTPTPIQRSSPTPTPATPPVTTPSSLGFFVSTATPSSFSFLYNNENENENLISRSPPPVARSTTTPSITNATPPPPAPAPTTEPPLPVRQLLPRGRGPKSFYVSDNYGQKINEVDVDNKVAEERHDHTFVFPRVGHWPTPIGTPVRSTRRKSLFNPGPTLASTVISSLKPRPRFGRPYHHSHHHQQHHHSPPPQFSPPKGPRGPEYKSNPYARRRPVEQPSSLRRSSNGDHRYVSFYRGQIGGQSWGYSYRL